MTNFKIQIGNSKSYENRDPDLFVVRFHFFGLTVDDAAKLTGPELTNLLRKQKLTPLDLKYEMRTDLTVDKEKNLTMVSVPGDSIVHEMLVSVRDINIKHSVLILLASCDYFDPLTGPANDPNELWRWNVLRNPLAEKIEKAKLEIGEAAKHIGVEKKVVDGELPKLRNLARYIKQLSTNLDDVNPEKIFQVAGEIKNLKKFMTEKRESISGLFNKISKVILDFQTKCANMVNNFAFTMEKLRPTNPQKLAQWNKTFEQLQILKSYVQESNKDYEVAKQTLSAIVSYFKQINALLVKEDVKQFPRIRMLIKSDNEKNLEFQTIKLFELITKMEKELQEMQGVASSVYAGFVQLVGTK